jgi:hypothetical protein
MIGVGALRLVNSGKNWRKFGSDNFSIAAPRSAATMAG